MQNSIRKIGGSRGGGVGALCLALLPESWGLLWLAQEILNRLCVFLMKEDDGGRLDKAQISLSLTS